MKFLITVVPADAADTALPDLQRWFGWSEGRDWHVTLDDHAWDGDPQLAGTPEQARNRALVIELRPGATAERLIGTLGAWLRTQLAADIEIVVRLPSGQEVTVSNGDDLVELRRAVPELIRPPSAPPIPPPPPRPTPGGRDVHRDFGNQFHAGRPPGPPLDPDDDWPRR